MPTDEQLNERDAKRGRKRRGSVDNEGRLRNLFRSQHGGQADWANASPQMVLALICLVTARGGALSFGTSRDGGAYSLTIMMGGERETLWFNGGADLDAELENVGYLIQTLQ